MKKVNISLAIVSVIALAIIHLSHAQNSPQDFLTTHNNARASVGVGPMKWDNNVAAYTQNYTNQLKANCKLVHLKGPYGENLAGSTGDLAGSTGDLTATAAVKMWVDEKAYYNYNSNTCATGKACGHYTQVVWKNSVRLGCAKVRCNNGGTIISCNYDPQGNFNNQRPY